MQYLALSNVSVTIGGYEECEEEHEWYTKTFKHECHQRGDSVFLNTRIYKIKQQSCPLNNIIATIIMSGLYKTKTNVRPLQNKDQCHAFTRQRPMSSLYKTKTRN